MDLFNVKMMEFKDMVGSVAIEDCPCSMFCDPENSYVSEEVLVFGGKEVICKGIMQEICNWPTLHKDIKEVLSRGTYNGAPMGMTHQEGNRTRAGRRWNNLWVNVDASSVIKMASKQATDTVSFIYSHLDEKMYSGASLDVVLHVRRVLDLKSFMQQDVSFGATNVASKMWRNFKESAIFLDEDVLIRLGADELRLQFRELHRRLETLGQSSGSSKLTSLQILALFLDPKNAHLYKDVEGVLSILARAAMASGVESICESWVSKMEHHCSAVRGILNQQRLEDEVNDIFVFDIS